MLNAKAASALDQPAEGHEHGGTGVGAVWMLDVLAMITSGAFLT